MYMMSRVTVLNSHSKRNNGISVLISPVLLVVDIYISLVYIEMAVILTVFFAKEMEMTEQGHN